MKHNIQPIGSHVTTVGALLDILAGQKREAPLFSIKASRHGPINDKLAVAVNDSNGSVIVAGHMAIAAAFADGLHEDDPPAPLTAESFKNEPAPTSEHASSATVQPSRDELDAAKGASDNAPQA